MILIYNLSGLLLGLGGLFTGLVFALSTRHLSVGVFATALVWSIFGWRSVAPVSRQKRPFPSVFFVPLAFIGLFLLVASVPLFVAERVMKALPRDPRAARLDGDEATLRSFRIGGDRELSEAVLRRLKSSGETGGNTAGDYSVLTRVGPEAVLVLVHVPDLKQHQAAGREQLLDVIEEAVRGESRAAGKMIYIGVKGRVAYGAVRAPDGVTKTGTAVSERPLYDFYGPEAPPRGETAAPSEIP